ncbi:hypothetical protein P7K49_035731 [Saguinus oedipus]|uniref:Uncharacterized protein n=1 Tax=Saguinus oedipus TaxID=9490 RepID=A0ABQ9TNI2_SAGOE|nr:hypothetical protein P7K49_035731 [Saguinus oedipus]
MAAIEFGTVLSCQQLLMKPRYLPGLGEMQGDTKEPSPKARGIRELSGFGHQVQGTLSAAGRASGSSCGNFSANPGQRSSVACTHFLFQLCNSKGSPGSIYLGSLGPVTSEAARQLIQRLVTRGLLDLCAVKVDGGWT